MQFDFGKFVTPFGNEVIESKDNWNYSRSLLFSLAIPYYHQGLRATYSPNDQVTLAGYLVNGWNNSLLCGSCWPKSASTATIAA